MRRSSISLAKLKLRLPTTIPSSSITIKIVELPSLNMQAAKYAATSTIFKPGCRCFGANRQTVELKLSFAFCVWPPKHLSSKSSRDKSSYTGRISFWTSGCNGGGVLQVPCRELPLFSIYTSCLHPLDNYHVSARHLSI